MSAEYAVVLGDRFTATSDKIGESADRAHAKITALQAAAKQGVHMGSVSLGGGRAAGSGAGRAAFTDATDGWSKARAAADKANRSMGLAHTAAISMDQRRTASMARESARREAISDRAMQREIRSATRTADRLAKIREKAAEKASHKYYYGGKKSFGSLYQSQHEHQVSGVASGIAGHLTPIGLAGAAGSAIGTAADAVGTLVVGSAKIAYNFGQATIAAQSMREESVEGFKAIFKSEKTANDLFDEARTIAKKTKFDTPEVVKRFNTLAARGFEANKVSSTYMSIADVESARGYGIAQRYQNSLANLNATSQPAWVQFKQGADASVGTKLAVPELGKRLGLKQTGGQLENTIRQMFRDKKISGSDAMESLISASNKRYNAGGKQGGFAFQQGDKTWSGAISNIKNGLGDVLNMRMDDQKGLGGLKTLLQAIGSSGGLFDQTSERGKEFATLVGKFVEDIFMPFGGITIDNTGNVLQQILDVGKQVEIRFRAVMREITAGFDSFMKTQHGSILDLATDIGVAIGTGILKVAGKLLERAWGATGGALAYSVGDSITESASEGMKYIFGEPWRKSGGADGEGESPKPAPKPAGSYALGGIVPGPTGSRQIIYAHGGEIVSGLHGEYGGRSSGGGGSTYNITVPIMIQGSHDPAATAQRTAAEVELVMDRYFGRLTAQG